jgi:hypothetical protein
MENTIKKFDGFIEKIDSTDNYNKKIKLYKHAQKKLDDCEKKLTQLKEQIENPSAHIHNTYDDQEGSEESIVPLDYNETKALLDKEEMFDYYVKRLKEINNEYNTNSKMSIENKMDLYIESYAIVRWCSKYLDKKSTTIEYLN